MQSKGSANFMMSGQLFIGYRDWSGDEFLEGGVGDLPDGAAFFSQFIDFGCDLLRFAVVDCGNYFSNDCQIRTVGREQTPPATGMPAFGKYHVAERFGMCPYPATERCSEPIVTLGLEHDRIGKVRVFIHQSASAFAVKEKFDHV